MNILWQIGQQILVEVAGGIVTVPVVACVRHIAGIYQARRQREIDKASRDLDDVSR